MSTSERWRPIPKLEGYYEVSNLGRIRSLDRYVKHSRGNGLRLVKGRMNKIPPCPRGYIRLNLYKEGKAHIMSLHRLVYSVFKGKIRKGMHIDHIDRNPSNNRITNLREATPSQSSFNTKPIIGTSKYKGVSFHSSRGKWRASIRPGNGQSRKDIGHYSTEAEAARAYNEASKKYHGEFAYINIIEDNDENN